MAAKKKSRPCNLAHEIPADHVPVHQNELRSLRTIYAKAAELENEVEQAKSLGYAPANLAMLGMYPPPKLEAYRPMNPRAVR